MHAGNKERAGRTSSQEKSSILLGDRGKTDGKDEKRRKKKQVGAAWGEDTKGQWQTLKLQSSASAVGVVLLQQESIPSRVVMIDAFAKQMTS